MGNLKQFYDNPNERKVYFRRHIPKVMYLQRQSLQSEFTRQYAAGLQPQWKLDNKTANYYIINNQHAEFQNFSVND